MSSYSVSVARGSQLFVLRYVPGIHRMNPTTALTATFSASVRSSNVIARRLAEVAEDGKQLMDAYIPRKSIGRGEFLRIFSVLSSSITH